MGIVASDLMATSIVTLTPDMNLLQMDTTLFKRGVSGAPVVKAGALVGVASQFDLVRALWDVQHEKFERQVSDFANPYPIPLSAIEMMTRDAPTIEERLKSIRVADVMTNDPIVVRPDDSLATLADRMVEDQVHRLPVVERETENLVGLVSALDIVSAIRHYGLAIDA